MSRVEVDVEGLGKSCGHILEGAEEHPANHKAQPSSRLRF